jgi:glycosyltransferase involved in cell wall biosynthesis
MPQQGALSIKDLDNIDYLLFVSEFQKQQYRKFYEKELLFGKREEFDKKAFVVPNGVEEKFFKGKLDLPMKKGKCIYASTPFRGLDVLLNCWPEIKKAVPHAELHLFTGMSIYNQKEYPETAELLKIAKKMQKFDVFTIGPITKDRLAEEMVTSELMLYPNHYEETYCITCAEQLYAKRKVLTSNLGALKDFKDKGDIKFINGDAYSDEYMKDFITCAINILNNKMKFPQTNQHIPTWKDSAVILNDTIFKKTKVYKKKTPKNSKRNEMDSTL